MAVEAQGIHAPIEYRPRLGSCYQPFCRGFHLSLVTNHAFLRTRFEECRVTQSLVTPCLVTQSCHACVVLSQSLVTHVCESLVTHALRVTHHSVTPAPQVLHPHHASSCRLPHHAPVLLP